MKNLSALLILIAFTQVTYASPDDFIITIKSDNYGVSNLNQFTLPINPDEVYDYAVDCDNDGIVEASGLTGAYTCDYAQAGIYTIRIIHDAVTGDGFPALYFKPNTDIRKFISLDQWGTSHWKNMDYAFFKARNIVFNALDTPNFSQVYSMNLMFTYAVNLSINSRDWDVSSVITMRDIFRKAINIEIDTSIWNLQSLEDMSFSFSESKNVSFDISQWHLPQLSNMYRAFDKMIIPTVQYDSFLLNLSQDSLINNVTLNASYSQYCSTTAENARAILINRGWSISDLGKYCKNTNPDDLIITIQGDSFTIATNFAISGYNYSIDCDNDGVLEASAVQSDYTCNYNSNGTHIIAIKHDNSTGMGFPAISFGESPSDRVKILLLNNWGTSQWKSMKNAFRGANQMLISASDSPDFSEVTSFQNMFQSARFANPEISSWNTSSALNMSKMFESSGITRFNANSWNTSLVTDMNGMFNGLEYIELKISSWNTSSVTDMSRIFSGLSNVSLDVSFWDTSSLTNMSEMFYGCKDLIVNTSGWDTSLVTDMNSLFQYSINTSITSNGWDTSSVTNMSDMFYISDNILIDSSDWNTSSVTDMNFMFRHAKNINIDTSVWDTSSVITMYSIFSGNYDGISLNTTDWDTSLVENMAYMFEETVGATIDTSNWDTSSLKFMQHMFERSQNISIATNGWNTSLVTDMQHIFDRSINLTLDTSQWDTISVTDMTGMFKGVVDFSIDTSSWNTSSVTSMFTMFEGSKNTTINTSNWNTSSVTNMSYMLNWSQNLSIDTSEWDTSSVTNMSHIYDRSTNVPIDIDKWDIGSLLNIDGAFYGISIPTPLYDDILINFAGQNVNAGLSLNVGTTQYCDPLAVGARWLLVNNYNWTINDGGYSCNMFSNGFE